MRRRRGGGPEGAAGGQPAETEEDGLSQAKVSAYEMLRSSKHRPSTRRRHQHRGHPRLPGPQGCGRCTQAGLGGGAAGTSAARNAPCAARAAMSVPFSQTRPTACHMALSALVRRGLVSYIISQNVDGLHLRSGVPPSRLCELHGNVFRERCAACGKEYLRDFDVTSNSVTIGSAQALDEAKRCSSELRDTIVYLARGSPPTSHGANHAEAAICASSRQAPQGAPLKC